MRRSEDLRKVGVRGLHRVTPKDSERKSHTTYVFVERQNNKEYR